MLVSTKIVATILCGNSESFIESAVLSVRDWVDHICVLDTGITDTTLERIVAVAEDKLSVTKFEWCDDFAKARNVALVVAEDIGANWALTLDTDERIDFSGFASKAELKSTLESDRSVLSWMVWASDCSYYKERFIRVPSHLQWRGRTHEALYGATLAQRRVLRGCRFSELPKTEEQLRKKVNRDLKILLEETQREPFNPRWWCFLGQTYANLKEYRKAVDAYRQCFLLDGWPDESSWAAYSAASCLAVLNEFRQAEELCGLGMSRKPSVPELPWLAGWCCFKRGAWSDAVTWSKLAISITSESKSGDRREMRGAFLRHVPAWYEGPYDVLRFAYERLNRPELAQQAELDFQNTKQARLNDANQPLIDGNGMFVARSTS